MPFSGSLSIVPLVDAFSYSAPIQSSGTLLCLYCGVFPAVYEKKHLANILEKLSPSEYGLIKRIYYHGDSLRKISSDTGTAISTLQYRHKKLLAKLKRLMAADGYEE